MTQTLTGYGYIIYNGVTLSGPRLNVGFSVQPVRDDASRTTVGNRYSVVVEGIVTDDGNGILASGTTAETNIANLRAALTKDGAALIIAGHGFGAIEVNTNSSNRDLKYGPRTIRLEAKQVGSIFAIQINWVFEFEISECSSGSQNGILGNYKAINYQVEYSINSAGLTTRTVSGYIEIILNRTSPGGVFIPYTADDFRHIINPQVPVWFQRTDQRYSISPDKSRIDFSIIDREQPGDNGYPEGVVSIDVRHRIHSSTGSWNTNYNTIAGHVEISKPYPTILAWERALMIIRERVMWARQQNDNSVLLQSVDITESIFSKRVEFSVTYKILNSGLQQLLTDTGVFRPLESTNYMSWANSVKNFAWHERGIAGLKHTPQQDRIVDPCNQDPNTALSDAVVSYQSQFGIYNLSNKCPPKSRSYAMFKNMISIEIEGGSIVTHDVMSGALNSGNSGDNIILYDESQFSTPPMDYIKGAITQQIKQATIYIVLRGMATRVCYPCQFPDLKTIGGTTGNGNNINDKFFFVADESQTSHIMSGYVGGIKTYSATWQLRYALKNHTSDDIKDLLFDIEKFSIGTQDDPTGGKAKEPTGSGYGI